METVRLGGMALQNGVLVHGPTAWGCAVRDEEGTLHVASGRKPTFGATVTTPVLRGPLRLAEAFALLPIVRRALPQARFPFERPAVIGGIAASTVLARGVRKSRLLSAGGKEAVAAAAALIPAGSRCAARTSPRTTERSTSRSAPTRTGSRRRRSIPAAGRS
jgi:hypothetical protein